jgi:predicted Zn-dependent protease
VQSHALTAAQATDAARLLRSAHALNPDRSVVLLQAQLADRRGQIRRALRLAASVAHAEPLNAQAWYAVARYAAAADNTPLEQSSFLHLRALVPPVK